MPLSPEDLQHIATRTLAHYELHAQSYWEGTRDLHTFKAMGHRAVGLVGAPSAAALARVHSGCEVLPQNFLHLELPAQRYDGVFANAVLFHVPRQALPQVLRQLQACLQPGGVLVSSNPRGDGQEGWNGERYGAFHD